MTAGMDFGPEERQAYGSVVHVPGPDAQLHAVPVHDYNGEWYRRVDWLSIVNREALAGLHPHEIMPDTEYRFAQVLHKVVADNVVNDPVLRRPHPIIDRGRVSEGLGEYYGFYPPTRVRIPRVEQERLRFQDAMLEIANDYEPNFNEVSVVKGLVHVFRRHEWRYASKAAFGVLTGYGRALSGTGASEINSWLGLNGSPANKLY